MTDHMFKYRSAAFLIGEVCPEVKMGMYTKEELEDIESSPEYKPTEKVSGLDEKLNRKKVASVQQEPTAEETAKQLVEAESHVEDILPDTETPKSAPKPAPTDAEIQAELEKAALEDAEIAEFAKPVSQDAQNTAQDARTSKNSPSTDIPASERYFCKECDDTFAKPAGLNKDMCPKLHKNIVDRWAKVDKK